MKRRVAIGAALMVLASGIPGQARDLSSGLRGNPGQYFDADAYPPDALRAGEQGRVIARLEIDSTGRVVSCAVKTSSGSTSLDRTTCRIALDKITFTPATDRRGRPIATSYTLPVRWVLPRDDAPVTPTDVEVETTVSVDPAGEVVACNTRATPALPPQMEPCAEFPVGRPSRIRWTREGRPVGGTMTRTYRLRVNLDP